MKINVLCINKDNGKYVNIISNINIPEDIKYEFVIYFFDKIKNQKFNLKNKYYNYIIKYFNQKLKLFSLLFHFLHELQLHQ